MSILAKCFLSLILFQMAIADGNPAEDSTPEPILYLVLGNQRSNECVKFFLQPSCQHCGMLLAEGILKFLEKYSERYRVEIYLVTLTSCDLFIINLASNYARGNREEFWKCLVGFMRRHLATKSSDTQQCNLKEWKKTAKDFGLTDGAISAASGKATPEVKNELKKIIKKLKEYLTTSKADLPVIVRNEKKVDDIPT